MAMFIIKNHSFSSSHHLVFILWSILWFGPSAAVCCATCGRVKYTRNCTTNVAKASPASSSQQDSQQIALPFGTIKDLFPSDCADTPQNLSQAAWTRSEPTSTSCPLWALFLEDINTAANQDHIIVLFGAPSPGTLSQTGRAILFHRATKQRNVASHRVEKKKKEIVLNPQQTASKMYDLDRPDKTNEHVPAVNTEQT